ncbi:MAG TPA: hypothetical protein VM370_12560 [Candidatus Thermoplasmatota archaeon]|nr:hypothetical protein [Candidatus Thermoplasmatota archaeon]
MSAPATPPPKSFRGECPKCDTMSTHEEFFRERRAAKSEQAAVRGDFKTMHEYSFRCASCGQRNEKILDDKGNLHKWQGNRHTMMHVGE